MKFTKHFALILAFIMVINMQLTAERKISSAAQSNRKKISSSAGFSAKHKSKQITKFKNLEWMALGYNIVLGNPLISAEGSSLIDTGFTASMFKIEENAKTSKNWSGITTKIIDPTNPVTGWLVKEENKCSDNWNFESIQSTQKLKEEITKTISSSGGVPGIVNFSASAGFRNMVDKLNNDSKVINKSENKCSVYNSNFNENSHPNLTENFKKGLDSLKGQDFNDANENLFFEFIENFGTHHVDNMVFGSKIEYYSETSSSKFIERKEKGVNFETKADSDYLGVGGSFKYSKDTTSDNESNKNFSNRSVVALGGRLSIKKEDTDKWARDQNKTPMPIEYSVSSMLNFLESSKNNDYKFIKAQLEKAYGKYCEHLKKQGKINSCDGNVSNGIARAYVKEQVIANKGHFNWNVKCPLGSAISYISFESENDSDNNRVRYRCIHSTSVTNQESQCQHYNPPGKNFRSGKEEAMWDLVNLDAAACPNDAVLTEFTYTRESNQIKYKFKCCKASTMNCVNGNTLYNDTRSHRINEIHRMHPIDSSRGAYTPHYSYSKWRFIKNLKLEREGNGNNYRWNFEVCGLAPPTS